MKRLLVALLVVLLVAACAPTAPKPLQPVRAIFPAKETHYAAYMIAAEKGYYAAEGIALQIVEASGGASVAPVMAGEAEFTMSASAALTAILQGAPLKIVYSHMDRPNYQVWSGRSEVRTLADLKGKSIGIIGRGDTMELSARLVLDRAGVDPNGVAYTALGPGGARLAALQSGTIAAAVLSQADIDQLKRAGPKGSMLVDVAQEVRMLFNGLATTDRLLRERPALAAGFVRATLKGREYSRRYKDETLEIVGKYNGKPRESNEQDYNSILPLMTPDGTLAEEVQVADTRLRAGLVGLTTVRPIGEIYDYSLVRRANEELKASGWQPAR
jgi:NitT/TauT family transport system substrate-binding protein